MTTALKTISKTTGKFIRSKAKYTGTFVSEDHPVYKPEIGRYVLIVSHACPWANRCVATMYLKKLESCIDMLVVHPTWQRTSKSDHHIGWVFRDPSDEPIKPLCGFGSIDCDGCIPDKYNSAKTVREIYEISAKSSNLSDDGRTVFSVPILFDTKTKSIVNNEYVGETSLYLSLSLPLTLNRIQSV
jgi:glutathionyl-hydroquinone reductase